LQGRDRRFSFEWERNYFEFDGLNYLMNDARLGVLQWQVVLDKMENTAQVLLEMRIVRDNENTGAISEDDLVHRIETYFHVFLGNCDRFKLVFSEDDNTFTRSKTGGKVIKFVDNYSINWDI
jgi:hypothetical protein